MAADGRTEAARHVLPDALRGHWVDTRAPLAVRPYLKLARIERPIGWWLLLLPCWWSLALAAISQGTWPNLWHALLFLIGAVLMRGAGSTFNDIVDRDLDAQVARTRGRPLPSGQLSRKQAALFMVVLSLGGLLVLLQFNRFTIWLGMASLLIVAIYPFMKRITNLPQIVLGFAFSWGGLVGWSAATGSLAAPALLIYAAAVVWTIGYDTVYALQDIEDDEIAGIKSSARYFGDHSRLAVGICYGIAAILGGVAAWLAGGGWLSALAVAGFASQLGWQVMRLANCDGQTALMVFRSNKPAGLLLAAGLVLDACLKAALA
ncbi:MAG: 4-hydroxybenzoate octaprenyltransferase [Bosea sp. (in: a-proteobacteria)]